MQETIVLDAVLNLCGGGCVLLALLVIVPVLVRRARKPHVIDYGEDEEEGEE